MTEPTPESNQSREASPAPKAEPSHADSGGLRPPLRETREPEFGGAGRLKSLDADIEMELAEAMKGFSEKELLAGTAGSAETTTGPSGPEEKQKKGRVLAIRGGDVFVDVPGGRSQGVLSASQFPEGPPAVGTEVAFHIEGYDSENGLLLLALQGAAQTADWSSVAVGMIVEARVTETNKGGLAVDVNGIRGFMPISQIDLYRVEDTQQFVNQRLRSMVVEVKASERNLVVSRRALLEKEREENREKLWQELGEGQIREGIVRSIRDFGAFVDLGGADGLLHVSEMSWTRVKDPSTIVKPGQAVKVVVLKIDRERRKVSLGLKQLSASPWDDIGSKYFVGSLVKGKITRLMEFGAFVELEPGVEGLIHISELAPQRVRRVGDIVQAEQEVQVKVLNVDATQRRISLSLKAALPEEAQSESDSEGSEEAAEAEIKRPRRTTPLRGGIGDG
ncbi:MAG TPA: S1 RNA-binding domain-containing protein [Gemmataceae bacterium]|jgi:small subunit ribosomal protein S1|nr:S1 RNA-binding domain-containing protein [Gemmataceae bacterium]